LAFSLAWLYQDHAPLDGGAVLLELGSSGSQLPLEIQCCNPHRGHVLVHFPQCLVPLQEHLPHLRDRGGVFCSLGVLLHELVTHNFQPVLQPPVVGSQGFDESVQGVILVPVPVTLITKAVEVAVPLLGSTLQLLSPADKVWKKAKSRNAWVQKRRGGKLQNLTK
jgi:hypothetical protein